MAPRKPIKPYAVDIIKMLRHDVKDARKRVPTAMDLAEVLSISPQIIISPQNEQVEYDEDYLTFQIDPDSLEVDDVVVMGRAPSGQPIVLGKADWSNPDPFTDPDLIALQEDFNKLKKNTKHVKASVKTAAHLPLDGNTHGDLRIVDEDDSLQKWSGETGTWGVVASSSTGDFVDESGDTMTGDLIMSPGTMITLPDPPVQPSDVVNKAYVDYLFSLVGGGILIQTICVNVNYAALPTDDTILVDTTLNPVTITLPAVHIAGKEYFIKDKLGTAAINNITVISADGDTIDLSASFVMNVNYQGIMLISDGTDWFTV